MDDNSPTRRPAQFTTRFLFLLTGIAAVSLLPCALWGWLGVMPSILLAIVGVLTLCKQYSVAATMFFASSAFALMFYLATNRPSVSGDVVTCSMNQKTIMMALLLYHQDKGHFPPPYTTDAEGKPLHSWRVLILPYMEEQQLHDAIDLNKPWYDPENLASAKKMPSAYRCPSSPSKNATTAFVAIVGDRTAWPRSGKRRVADIVDGTENTLLFVESEKHRIHWMSTADPGIETLGPSRGSGETPLSPGAHFGGANCVFCDGHNQFTREDMDLEDFLSLLTIDGGETVKDTW